MPPEGHVLMILTHTGLTKAAEQVGKDIFSSSEIKTF
jgi:hypothetical protein